MRTEMLFLVGALMAFGYGVVLQLPLVMTVFAGITVLHVGSMLSFAWNGNLRRGLLVFTVKSLLVVPFFRVGFCQVPGSEVVCCCGLLMIVALSLAGRPDLLPKGAMEVWKLSRRAEGAA